MFSVIFMVLVPLIIFSIGFFITNFSSNPKAIRVQKQKLAFVMLALAIACIGVYIKFVSSLYIHLVSSYPQLHVSKYEPEYFALQTLTTVGYGTDLCNFYCDPNSSSNISLSWSQKRDLHSGFQKMASTSMATWFLSWIILGTGLLNFAYRILFH